MLLTRRGVSHITTSGAALRGFATNQGWRALLKNATKKATSKQAAQRIVKKTKETISAVTTPTLSSMVQGAAATKKRISEVFTKRAAVGKEAVEEGVTYIIISGPKGTVTIAVKDAVAGTAKRTISRESPQLGYAALLRTVAVAKRVPNLNPPLKLDSGERSPDTAPGKAVEESMMALQPAVLYEGGPVAIALETAVKASISEKEINVNIKSIVTAAMSNQCMVQGVTPTMEQTVGKIVKQVSNDVCKLVKQVPSDVKVLAIICPASSVGKRDRKKTGKDSTSTTSGWLSGWWWFNIILSLVRIIDIVQFFTGSIPEVELADNIEGNTVECIFRVIGSLVGQFVCPIPGLGMVIGGYMGPKVGCCLIIFFI